MDVSAGKNVLSGRGFDIEAEGVVCEKSTIPVVTECFENKIDR